MTVLPDPKPTATAAGQTANQLTDAVITAAVDHAIEEARQRGTTPRAIIGNTPAVPQPDTRIAPQWAVGIAVASIGVGAGSTGLGRFALVISAPFAGTEMVLTAAGVAIGKARTPITTIHNHNSGPVDQREIHTKNIGAWVKNTNRQ